MTGERIKILVTGSSGQLGLALQEESKGFDNKDFVFLTRKELDITNKKSISDQLEEHYPDVVINTAAYTAVDKAENDKNTAFFINEKGVRNIAEECKSRNITLLHISTDYVFDGENNVPYKETDTVNPQTVYGKSKLAGELAIQEIAPPQFYIIRTSWLYSKYGRNFYKTMLRLAKEGKEISVVNDQWGSPTLANDLAKALIHISVSGDPSKSGIYHYSGEGECTWYAFAKAILEKYYPNKHKLVPISTQQFATDAKRPKYSVLNKTSIKQAFNSRISHWPTII